MATKDHITLRGVDWKTLPFEWTKQLGLSPDKDEKVRVDVTLDLVVDNEQEKGATLADIKAAAHAVQRWRGSPPRRGGLAANCRGPFGRQRAERRPRLI